MPTPVLAAAVVRAGGCIRFAEAGPRWHQNPSHVTVGIDVDSLRISGGDLWFTLRPPHLPVVAAIATADETLITRGISAGVSGGYDRCMVRFHRAGDGRLDLGTHYRHLVGRTANLWVAVLSAPAAAADA